MVLVPFRRVKCVSLYSFVIHASLFKQSWSGLFQGRPIHSLHPTIFRIPIFLGTPRGQQCLMNQPRLGRESFELYTSSHWQTRRRQCVLVDKSKLFSTVYPNVLFTKMLVSVSEFRSCSKFKHEVIVPGSGPFYHTISKY